MPAQSIALLWAAHRPLAATNARFPLLTPPPHPHPQDLEYLISKAVDITRADYAVITGVQVHNWSTGLGGANFEFVAPSKCYVVVGGEKTEIDLEKLPPLTPRQLNVIAGEDSGLEAGISRCARAFV